MAIDDLIQSANPAPVDPLAADERIRVLLKENTRLKKQLSAEESGWSIIKSVLEDCYDKPLDINIVPPKSVGGGNSTETAVLHLTDIHYGKKTETYGVEVVESRLIELCKAVSEITDLRRRFAKVGTCKLLLGGDMIEGEGIFPGQAWETDADLIAQMIKAGPEIVLNVILSLLQTFENVEVVGVPGNHGRQGKFNSKTNNADSIYYEIVRKLVTIASPAAAERIKWDIPLDRERGKQWYGRFNICGPWEGMLVHGDQIKGQLGFPWYGFGKKVGGWRTSRQTGGFQFLFSGHFHTHAAFDLHDCTVFSTGSVESSNAYALENFAACGTPKQRLVFFNDKYGALTDYPIHLT